MTAPDTPPLADRGSAPEGAPLPERRGYHHGALREALLTAARRLIAEKGPAGFTLADATRLAGVSGAAPYRHFRDKDELVAEVARQGFQDFSRRLGQAAGVAAAQGGVEAFRAMGRAYLAFAREEPGAYAAMFSPAARPGSSGLALAGEKAFIALMEGMKGALGGRMPPGVDPMRLAIGIWALSHGVATLSKVCSEGMGVDPEQVLDDGVTTLIRAALHGA